MLRVGSGVRGEEGGNLEKVFARAKLDSFA